MKQTAQQQLAALQEIAGHPLIVLAETGSTNSDALRLGRGGAPTGTIVLALRQNMGRGRLGRRWISRKGCGLTFSIITRPALDPDQLPKITLATGVALCRAVVRIGDVKPALKWPNDLLIDGRKCGGILAETEFSGRQPLVVVGIGININLPPTCLPPEIKAKTTSLADHLPDAADRVLQLLTAIVEENDRVIALLERGNFASLLAEWKGWDYTLGRRLSWVSADGTAVYGISQGVDDQGLLHVRDDHGLLHEVISGDITLLHVPPDGSSR